MQWKNDTQATTTSAAIHGKGWDANWSLLDGYKYFDLALLIPSKDSTEIQRATWPRDAIAEARRVLDEIEAQL